MLLKQQINNEIYSSLGEKWYKGTDYVAMLRAEANARNPWIIKHIQNLNQKDLKILDIGCGGGLLTNELSKISNKVTGIDIHSEALNVAKKYNSLNNVNYLNANALELPFENESFDIICALDLLEHVDCYEKALTEGVRVLKKQGLFFYHTFNRNLLTNLFVIKGMEWFVKDTPKNLHVHHLFIKPKELTSLFSKLNCENQELKGLNPKIFSKEFLELLIKGRVSQNFKFEITSSLMCGYIGFCKKIN